MNISVIKSHRVSNQGFETRRYAANNRAIINDTLNDHISETRHFENGLTYGYTTLLNGVNYLASTIKKYGKNYHVLSGVAVVRTAHRNRILSKGSVLNLNGIEDNDIVNVLSEEPIKLVWWNEVAEEDLFLNDHSNKEFVV